MKSNKKNGLIFLGLIAALSFATFWRAFSFDFWRDDWYAVWGVFHNPFYLYQWGVVKLHPISAAALIISVWLFRANPLIWEIYGYCLRFVDACFIYLFASTLTKSKKTGFYAGLFFASTPIGIEAFDWPSAIANSLLVPLFCSSFYFWVHKHDTQRNMKVAWGLLVITVLSDPFRGIFLPVLLFTYDFLIKIQRKKQIPRLKIKKILIFIFIAFAIIIAYSRMNTGALMHYSGIFQTAFSFPPIIVFRKFFNVGIVPFNAIGNLFSGWILQIPDHGDASDRNFLSISIGVFVVGLTVRLFFSFLTEKTKIQGQLLFLLLWVFVLYLSNWAIDVKFIPGITNRYFTLSVIGFVSLLAIIIERMPFRYRNLLFVLLLFFNIYSSNTILQQEVPYRSKKAVDVLWDQINIEVPKKERYDLFIFQGDSYVTRYALLPSYNIPFGNRRGYNDPDEFPVVTNYSPLVQQLLCDTNFIRPSISSRTILQKTRMPLSHVYSWNYNDKLKKLVNTTDTTRGVLEKTLSCHFIR